MGEAAMTAAMRIKIPVLMLIIGWRYRGLRDV